MPQPWLLTICPSCNPPGLYTRPNNPISTKTLWITPSSLSSNNLDCPYFPFQHWILHPPRFRSTLTISPWGILYSTSIRLPSILSRFLSASGFAHLLLSIHFFLSDAMYHFNSRTAFYNGLLHDSPTHTSVPSNIHTHLNRQPSFIPNLFAASLFIISCSHLPLSTL